MMRYLARRLPSAVAVLLLASLLIFFVLRLVPGDPASSLAGPDASAESIAAIRHSLGLDRSIPAQYVSWIGSVLTFDLGRSYVIGGQISDLVLSGLVNTVVLAVTALVLAVLVSLILSVAAVVWPKRWLTSAVAGFNTLAVALPPFVSGVLLVLVFAVLVPVLPSGGVPPQGFWVRPDISVQYLLLPAVCLALPVAAALTRFLTESLRTELGQPYVLTARALGVSRWNLVTRSALRNALPTMVTALGLQTGQLLGGAVLVEAIFAWPGIGQLIEQGISRRDYPVVQVLLLLSVSVFVLVQLVTDVVHAYLDPRIRIGGTS
ncbi:binding-protein-dependent transport system inner membrane component family protein [Rhodococcus sp. MTM3W5.2]|uniref:ABC transporter permease n=1 Tax=Rhodococcus sp. MTM3W5.2 TaxID=1805827 RepID=UPI000979770B|nr:ABC transporter permease [Rhodococcus sp. MTM3W5.2]AQA20955.1 binding-protein-dependent transport system inner membrane component family protein [Rhodococcus sp. MTM3W5.2]